MRGQNSVSIAFHGGALPALIPLASGQDLREQARRIAANAHELLLIAQELELLAEREDGDQPDGLRHGDDRWSELARIIYRDRRVREDIFGDPGLFGEPAWDLLLDLFIAAREGKQVPVTSACIGAAVPTTTALRWLSTLESAGLVVRENDARDARRVFVRLTDKAYRTMIDYFERSSIGRRTEDIRGARIAAPEASFMLRV